MSSTSVPGDNGLAVAIRSRLREGRLPCADAFALAREWHVAPLEVAREAQAQEARIGWCQLGLFVGAVKHDKAWPAGPVEVPADVQSAILETAVEGRLPCARAWGLAARFGMERMDLGRAVNALGVRIVQCQLGCFA